MELARLLKQTRLEAGLTQKELAQRMGTTQSGIARWESGTVSPRWTTVERLVHACGRQPRVSMVREVEPDRDQVLERLSWSPAERFHYLLDMIAFEERAHAARRS